MLFCRRPRLLAGAHFVLFVALLSSISGGAEPALQKSAAKPASKNVKLPGLVINLQDRCVDLEATVCLDEGMLELIACTKGSKEHESILAISAKPMHVHAALLLLGAKNGNPAMRRPVDEKQTRWVHVPPRGDRVDVYLVLKNKEGKRTEHPISDFVTRTEQNPDDITLDSRVGNMNFGKADKAGEKTKFPHTFLFAGSHLRDNGSGPRQYLADHSGHVISIVTYGDELLCLPGMHDKGNDSLMWQVVGKKLPKVGSKVTLRLRPQAKPAVKTDTVLPRD